MPRTDPGTGLAGLTILVTRPEHQAAPLCHLIEAAGGQPLRLPLLTIGDSSSHPSVKQHLSQLDHYDLAIFISPNAVRYGTKAIGDLTRLNTLQLATVGSGSARTLSEITGRTPDLVPQEQFDSEGLLALPALQQMTGKRVIIFRGNGGREHLAETLRQRGASVDYVEVYQRSAPPPLPPGDDRLDKADIIVITSAEGLNNLMAITPSSEHKRLFATPLLLVSERAMLQARKLGFNSDCLICQSNNEVIVTTLTEWAQQRTTNPTEE